MSDKTSDEVVPVELLKELRIEGAIVPNRRGELYRDAAEEIQRLRAERDEARKMLTLCVPPPALGDSWDPRVRLAYVSGRLEAILPCDDDNRPVEAHARKVVAHVASLRAYAELLRNLLDGAALYVRSDAPPQSAHGRHAKTLREAIDAALAKDPSGRVTATEIVEKNALASRPETCTNEDEVLRIVCEWFAWPWPSHKQDAMDLVGTVDAARSRHQSNCEVPGANVLPMRLLRSVPKGKKLDPDAMTQDDYLDLTACLEREHVKHTIQGVYKTIEESGFSETFKAGLTTGVEEIEFRLLESWGEDANAAGPKGLRHQVWPHVRACGSLDDPGVVLTFPDGASGLYTYVGSTDMARELWSRIEERDSQSVACRHVFAPHAMSESGEPVTGRTCVLCDAREDSQSAIGKKS